MSNTIYTGICPKCQKEFSKEILWNHIPKFCSKICANSRGPMSIKQKKQNSKWSKNNPRGCAIHYPYTKIKFNKVYGKFFIISQKITEEWAKPIKLKSATLLSHIFNFKLGQPNTIYKIYESISILQYHYFEEQLSANNIKILYNINYTDFGMFLKKALNFNLRNPETARKLYFSNRPEDPNKTEKEIYYRKAKFKLTNPDIPKLPGFEILRKYGWYNPFNNLTGLVRDHMFSRIDGYNQNIPPKLISHPANCQLIHHLDNSIKGGKSCISLIKLNERIKHW